MIISLILCGCKRVEEKREQVEKHGDNTVELNLNNTIDERRSTEESGKEELDSDINTYEDFYLSGRTGLLSIQSSQSIGPEDFKMGGLYVKHDATVAEKELIEISRSLFKSLMRGELDLSSVDPIWKTEVREYINYFVIDKIALENIVYGKPDFEGDEAIVRLRLHPDNISGNIYYKINDENRWMIIGIELDLNRKKDIPAETWYPSIQPSPLGL